MTNEAEPKPDPEPGDSAPPLARWLTLPGRLLLIAAMGAAGLTFYVFFTEILQVSTNVPVSRLVWFGPAILGGATFFFGAAFILEKLGIRVYRRAICRFSLFVPPEHA